MKNNSNSFLGILAIVGTCALCMAAPGSAGASEITTSTFGPLTPANFGGTGIPNNPVEITTTSGIPGPNALSQPDTLTLGLSATPYGPNGVALGNNGAGTFYASPGASPDNAGRSTFNIDYYIGDVTGNLAGYTFELMYGDGTHSAMFNPVATTLGDATTATSMQNSENMDFSFFGGPIGYNMNANDDYSFTLEAFQNGIEVGSGSTINVVVGSGSPAVPDNASTAGLLGGGIISLLAFAKKIRLLA